MKKPLFILIAITALSLMLAVLYGSSVKAEVSKKIPGTINIKYIQKQYGPVVFDHTKHAAMAGNCGKCHHSHNEKINSTCKECHALDAGVFKASAKQAFLPCSACHSDYSPDSPGVPGLKVAFHKKCFECHLGMGELGSSPAGCAKTCHVKKKA